MLCPIPPELRWKFFQRYLSFSYVSSIINFKQATDNSSNIPLIYIASLKFDYFGAFVFPSRNNQRLFLSDFLCCFQKCFKLIRFLGAMIYCELILTLQLFHDGGRYHIETSPLICSVNQRTGFYMITAFVMKEFSVNPTKWLNTLKQFVDCC